MIICDETCGEEAILAARLAPLAAGRVGAGKGTKIATKGTKDMAAELTGD